MTVVLDQVTRVVEAVATIRNVSLTLERVPSSLGGHEFLPGEKIEVALDPGDVFVFDAGRLVAAPGAA